MPIDFKKIFDEAQTASELQERLEKEAIDQAQKERNERTASDVTALQNAISTYVEKAKMEFGENGIQLVITEELDVANRAVYVKPHIKIHTLSPKRRKDGWQNNSIPIFFASDGKYLFAYYDEGRGVGPPKQEAGKVPLGDHERLIEEAFEFLAGKHFEMLSRLLRYPEDFVT